MARANGAYCSRKRLTYVASCRISSSGMSAGISIGDGIAALQQEVEALGDAVEEAFVDREQPTHLTPGRP